MLRLSPWRASRRLPLLYSLLLLNVSLLQLLRLLLVTLLYALFRGVIRVLLRQLLVLLVLPLLQLLPLLILFGVHLFLLLLIFLVDLRIARVRRSRPFVARQIVWMHHGVPSFSRIAAAIRWRLISPACFPRRHHRRPVVERARTLGRRNRRLALIHRRAQLPVRSRLLHMLLLRRHRPHVPLIRVRVRLFLTRRPPFDPAPPAVIAHVVVRPDVDPLLVHIVNYLDIHIVHRAVIEEVSPIPPPAFISVAEVPKSIADSSVPPDLRPPISGMKQKRVSAPSPPCRRPQITHLRRFHPCPRHPVIVIAIPVPVAWRPDIAVTRAYRLLVNRQRRRREPHRDSHAHLRK